MIKRFSIVFIIFTLLITVVAAQTDSGKEVLLELFNVEDNKVETLFDQSFLSQISVEQINEILEQYQGNLGELEGVEGNNGEYTLIFTRGTAPAQLVLNSEQKITGLWFGNWALTEDNLNKIISEFKDINGTVSVSIIKNNRDNLFSYNGDKKMAVGSSFKLYVLKAVYEAVEKGDITWDSIVNLEERDRSIPSGIIQDWPEGTPLTIKTLTNLMISLSDNTATDILINTIGRRNIEKYVDKMNHPFLKTGDLFRLKYAADLLVQEEYIKGNIEEKRKIVADLEDKNIDIGSINNDPVLIDSLEWFFSTQELCGIIYDLQEADELMINPGLAEKEDWYLTGYKGGSEPGVLEYTHLLQKEENGDIYTISVTVNNPQRVLDNNKITELTIRIISLIKDGKI